MSDFYSQLERQLVAAGERRAGRGRWRLAVAGRGRTVLAIVTASIAVVAAVAFVPALGSGDSSDGGGGDAAPPAVTAPPAPPGGESLRGIEVAVLNATTITGLGREVGEALAANGATLHSINSAAQQDLSQSVVDFRAGREEDARLVARVLGVRTIRALSASNSAAASTAAGVVVWVGSDRRPG